MPDTPEQLKIERDNWIESARQYAENADYWRERSEKAEANLDALTAAATKTRDRLAWWLWSEDDSGDDNELVAAYDELRAILGPSTEEGVAATLAHREPHDA